MTILFKQLDKELLLTRNEKVVFKRLCELIEERLEDKVGKPLCDRKRIQIELNEPEDNEAILKDAEEKWKKLAVPTKLEQLLQETFKERWAIAMTYAKREGGNFIYKTEQHGGRFFTFQNDHYEKQYLKEMEALQDRFNQARWELEKDEK